MRSSLLERWSKSNSARSKGYSLNEKDSAWESFFNLVENIEWTKNLFFRLDHQLDGRPDFVLDGHICEFRDTTDIDPIIS